MKHLKLFEKFKDTPLDKSHISVFKKPAYKMTYNQSKPSEEGVFLGKNKKWQVIVKSAKTGKLTTYSQHTSQDEAQKAYDNYYKNNIKTEKELKKPKKQIIDDYDDYDYLTDFKRSPFNTKYEIKAKPQEKDWVIINYNIIDDKTSKEDQKFIDFINNNIGKIILKKGSKTYIVEYKNIPNKIDSYFINNTKTFYEKDIKYFSHRKSELEKYITKKETPIKEIKPKIINFKSPITMGKLYNDIVSFVSNINDILPYKENEYYTGKYNLSYITITKVVKNKVKKIVGIISIKKENVPHTISKYGFGKNINEVIFTIYFKPYNPFYYEKDPYIDTIMNYLANIISDNNKIPTKKTEKDSYEITFHENQYDDVINNINKLSMTELKSKIQETSL
jgi:hypothetical protein